jgi:hypothetical protein
VRGDFFTRFLPGYPVVTQQQICAYFFISLFHRIIYCGQRKHEPCPHCGKPMTMNLRADDKFVEDEGWHQAAERYESFLRTRADQKTLFLELGVGYNTPVIIKYPFWQMTAKDPRAVYANINFGQAEAPAAIRDQSICINADIASALERLL